MLKTKDAKKKLKALGYFKGLTTNVKTKAYKTAILKIQTKYFDNIKDRDGICGEKTSILIENAYRFRNSKYFNLKEFKCECGGKYCTGYPHLIDKGLIADINKVRDEFGALTITSGVRCQRFNDSLVGSISKSEHIEGKAADFAGSPTSTRAKRKKIMSYMKKFNDFGYIYSVDTRPNLTNMGNAIHFNVK